MSDKFPSFYLVFFTFICGLYEVFAVICNGGASCTGSQHCCPSQSGCCYDDSHNRDDGDDRRYSYGYRLSIWNMWYFWFVVLFVLMSCFGGCGYYKQRQRMLRNQQGHGQGFLSVFQVPQRRQNSSRIITLEAAAYTSPTGFGFPPSTGIGQNLAPPPYSEVVNNPQMFPANTKSGMPGQDGQLYFTESRQHGNIYSNQSEAANQMPQPPPYSELSNQNSASSFSDNNISESTTFSNNQGPSLT